MAGGGEEAFAEEEEEGGSPIGTVPLLSMPWSTTEHRGTPTSMEGLHGERRHVRTPTSPSTSPTPCVPYQHAPIFRTASPLNAASLVSATTHSSFRLQLTQVHMSPTTVQVTPPKLTPHEISLITEAASKPGPNGTFQCTLCNKQFGYKNGLIRHIRLTHVGEKPYECNICQRRFGYKHILLEHQNLHYGHRPYSCTQCDKRFAARSNLIQHRTVHKRPYVCSLCNKSFDKEDQLKKHLFAHPQALLNCKLCKYAAQNQQDLNKHIIETHATVIQESIRRNVISGDVTAETLTALFAQGVVATPGDPGIQVNICPRTPCQTEEQTQRQSVSPPEGTEESADEMEVTSIIPNLNTSSTFVTNAPPANIVRPQIPGHRIDAICSQLSTSIAGSTTSTEHTFTSGGLQYVSGVVSGLGLSPQTSLGIPGLIIKKECESDEGLNASIRPNDQPVYPPVGTVAAQPIARNCVPISPTDSNDSKSSPLPGIEEMFARRSASNTSFPNFAFPTLAVSNENRSRVHNELPNTMLDKTSSNLSCSLPNQMTNSPLTSVSVTNSGMPLPASLSVTHAQRPTAQLPPITQQAFHNRREQGIQHSAPIPGFPALEDVIGYYMGQGKLFKCHFCNILFYERGMFFLHASLHGPTSPWECSICHKICADKNEFTIHFVNQQHSV